VKSRQNLSTSSSSSSLSSMYTSDSSEEELNKVDRLSNGSRCSFPYDQPAETVGLPPDYQFKYSSLQDWMAKRKSLRNAMGSKADITRWLQNKKQRTPLEERVLALSQPNVGINQEKNIQVSSIQPFKCGPAKSGHSSAFSHHVRSDATEYEQSSDVSRTPSVADISTRPSDDQTSSHAILQPSYSLLSRELSAGQPVSTLDIHTMSTTSGAVKSSDSQHLSQKSSKSRDHLTSHESASDELISVLDEYLTQRRIRLLDLFRCVDVSRCGRCSRQDFHYVLKLAKVPLTHAQVEQLADSLAVDNHPDCVDYSQLAVRMNRHSEMRLFRQLRGVHSQSSLTVNVSDFSSLSVKEDSSNTHHASPAVNSSTADHASPAVCPEVTENEKAKLDGEQKRSYCRRVVKLFRDNELFGEAKAGKKSSSRTRDRVAELKSTLDDDEGLATRLNEIRLHDRIEYEATRDAVRRHRLPVRGKALRRGLLSSTDLPHRTIDVRRLPREHMLAIHTDSKHAETHIGTHFDSDDSLDKEMEDDERRRATGAGDETVPASGSRAQFGLRERSAASSRHRHSTSSTRHGQSAHGSMSTISGDEEEDKEEEEEEEEEKENDDEKDVKWDDSGAGDAWSTRASGRLSWRTRQDLELRRMQWELDEEIARKNAIYWPGRVDHVRLYHTPGDRGGHAIFERVGQTWYNDDPRYHVVNNCDDEAVDLFHCYNSSQRQDQSQWASQQQYQ